ncbi:MAG TPA: hypothetical protein VMW71_06810 [Thermoplasmata archaeon]|nr:hypothetical protein [Thermoplasmata archaeon]
MRGHDVWRTFTVLFVLALATISALMVGQGEDIAVVTFVTIVAISVYLYIIYKRYHVELLPESDLRLFDDPDDLRILCRIYGLPDSGSPNWLRHRLAQFSRQNDGRSFVWVAPRFMKAIASNLEFAPGMDDGQELPEDSTELLVHMVSSRPSAGSMSRPLVWGKSRSTSRRRGIASCPVCESAVDQRAPVCGVCGADLEFYDALLESKIGRRLIAQKADGHGRKH